jgi:hypothetical protein
MPRDRGSRTPRRPRLTSPAAEALREPDGREQRSGPVLEASILVESGELYAPAGTHVGARNSH